MDPSFDPYHKWLGIPPHEQPANLYRLLGVALFEPDLDVISSAADQRMAHLRSFQTGANAELSQKLLNEVSRARVRLLDFNQKAAYDAELRTAIARVTGVATGKIPPAAAKKASPARPGHPSAARRASGSTDMRRDLPRPIHADEEGDIIYDLVDESLPSLNETAASVVLASPQPLISTTNKASATRHSPARRPNRTLYGIVTGGILGLVIGYLLLTNLNPKADFLGLFSSREPLSSDAVAANSSAVEEGPIEQPNTKQVPKKLAENSTTPTNKSATTKSETETPADKSRSATAPKSQQPSVDVRPKPTPSSEPAKKVDPTTRLPKTIGLPKLNDTDPALLANFDGADELKIDSLELVAKLADSSAQHLAARSAPRWPAFAATSGR